MAGWRSRCVTRVTALLLQGIWLTGCPLSSHDGQRQAFEVGGGHDHVCVVVCWFVCWLQVTENGVPVPNESEKPLQEALRDNFRLDYYR